MTKNSVKLTCKECGMKIEIKIIKKGEDWDGWNEQYCPNCGMEMD